MSDKLENFHNLQNVQEFNFDDGETKVVVLSKFRHIQKQRRLENQSEILRTRS